jgi:hypothetical protein
MLIIHGRDDQILLIAASLKGRQGSSWVRGSRPL